jgi:serine/threonine protein kinase
VSEVAWQGPAPGVSISGMIGRQIGNYRIVRELGKGGMGTVYEAVHPAIGVRVAVKILHPEVSGSPTIVERFFSEARVVAAIGHEHIVAVSDVGQLPDGPYYLVMELLEGETLAERMRRQGPLAPAQAATIAAEAAAALASAHQLGVIHRDVKPENIFLMRHKRGDFVKVLDFGIAKLTAEAQLPSVHTETGTSLGTPRYMSPEQCAGLPRVDHRADVYSLGVVLFEMVTGRVPFDAEGAGLLYMKHMQTPPPAPRSLVPSLPAELEALILRALAKEPADRFATMDAMREAIERLLPSLPEQARAPSAAARRPTPPTRPDRLYATTRRESASEVMARHGHVPGRRRWFVASALFVLLGTAALWRFWAGPPVDMHPPTMKAAQVAAPPQVVGAPRDAAVTLHTEPEGARVLVEGKEKGVTPKTLRLPLGGNELVFVRPGYRPQPRHLEVARDTDVTVVLKPLPKPAPSSAPPPTPKPEDDLVTKIPEKPAR